MFVRLSLKLIVEEEGEFTQRSGTPDQAINMQARARARALAFVQLFQFKKSVKNVLKTDNGNIFTFVTAVMLRYVYLLN